MLTAYLTKTITNRSDSGEGVWPFFVSVFVDWSIDETKEPEGYFVAETCFDVVGHDVAVGQVGNL